MVRQQSQTMDGARGRRPAHGSRSCSGTNGKQLRATPGRPGAARLHRRGVEEEHHRLEILSNIGAVLPEKLRRVDSHGETARDAGKTHSGVGRTARRWREARIEIEPSHETLLATVDHFAGCL